MTTRSQRLFAGNFIGRASNVIYQCPSGTNTILKSVYVTAHGTVSGDVAIHLYGNDTSADVVLFSVPAIAETTHFWEGWVVLEYGDAVYLTFTTGQFGYWGSGAELPVTST